MSDLTLDEIRIDRLEVVSSVPLVVVVDAAAEMTRYHCLMANAAGGWWVMCENLTYGVALPVLPSLAGWHWSYIGTKFDGPGKPRTAMALCLLMQLVHDEFVAPLERK